ncbi:MAG: hypothetical protein A2X08_10360 [Bacteroidetes bacterium GWA2_32_17]|nr:MAG: hypothetical protein A2X08_10360 [Bacteroidetes bacterium GWA2_32_17]
MKKILYYIILFTVFSARVFSQNYNIKHYTVQDGLLHSFVNDIIQDKRGSIWMATGGGLCKFNSVEFTNYTKKDGLNNYRLLSLAEDDFNNIWIGSLLGINVFDGDSIYTLKSATKRVLALKKSLDGQMWVASNEGVEKMQFNNGKFITTKLPYDFGVIDFENIFQDRNLNSFLVQTENNLFIGLNNTVYVYNNKEVKKIKFDKNIKVYSACKLENNDVIFGTNNGIFKYNGYSLELIKNNRLNAFHAFKIEYKNNKIWMIGNWSETEKSALYLVSISLKDEKYFRKISDSNGLIEKATSLLIDYENDIWIGSNGGLSVLKGEEFVNYTIENGLIGNKIWGVYQDNDKNVWVGTINEGLSIITKDSILNFDTISGLPDMYIGAIFQVEKNEFLLGTAKKGICKAEFVSKLNRYKFSQLNIELNIGITRVDCILRDRKKILWVASSKGLYYSNDGKNFKHKPLFQGDSNQVFIQKIFESSEGDLYIGTKQMGLFLLKDNKVENFLNDSKKELGISSICEDIQHNIWVGSQREGVLKIDNGKCNWITEKDGLKSNLIYILQSDKSGNIWIGSNLGLDRLNCIKYNKTNEIDIRHYDTNDGLQELEMNLNGSIEDSYENLWFATNNGILKYDYHYEISNRIPPIINLLNVKLHSNSVDWTKYSDSLTGWNKLPVNPVLPYNDNHITFEFVGISFKTKEIKYTWKLEGFDKKWVPPSYSRQVVYSNLPYGEYIFKLKSSNNDDVWNKEPLEFRFEILPPFWAEWWFISISILFLGMLIYFSIRLRMNSLIKHQKELENQISQRTEKISLQKEELESQIDIVNNQKRQIENIHLQLSDSIEYAKRIQDAALPLQGNLQSIVADAFVFFKPRDVVSGDFYWWAQMKPDNVLVAAVVDCTGHGVPGAFMSLLGISFLREIVIKEYITHPAVILRKLRKEIINSLNQKDEFGEQKDGMDMALISVNLDTLEMQFAGANNPLYIIRAKVEDKAKEYREAPLTLTSVLIELKGDKMPIAIYRRMDKFTNNKFQLHKGDQVYLFSDGFIDQFGGKKGKKFLCKQFKQLLLNNANKPMTEQCAVIEKTLNEWIGNNEQVDDITILGLKL